MKFDEVIGQEETQQQLLQMVAEGRLPHALMLCGPEGAGKLALALAFASHLLKDSVLLQKWEHPDLIFTFPIIRGKGMSADHKPVSDDYMAEWRSLLSRGPYFSLTQWLSEIGANNEQAIIFAGESDALIHKLSLKSSQGGYKVSIIWLPERMRPDCANKILKLLEEPPSQTVFIMVCEQPDLLLDTIRSRVQRIDVKPIADDAVAHALETRRGIDGALARRIARIANGNWLRAVEMLEADNENLQFLDLFKMLMRMAYLRDVRGLKKWTDTIALFGREKQKRLLSYFLRMIRENFMFNFRQPELNYMTEQEEQFAVNFARFVNESNVIDIAETLQRSKRDIAQNANPNIVFFDLALNMILYIIR